MNVLAMSKPVKLHPKAENKAFPLTCLLGGRFPFGLCEAVVELLERDHGRIGDSSVCELSQPLKSDLSIGLARDFANGPTLVKT